MLTRLLQDKPDTVLPAPAKPRRGRPRITVDLELLARLRAEGMGWRPIAATLGITVRTARRRWREVLAASKQARQGVAQIPGMVQAPIRGPEPSIRPPTAPGPVQTRSLLQEVQELAMLLNHPLMPPRGH